VIWRQYADKRQVLLTDNADGNIVITRNTGDASAGLRLVNRIDGGDENNVTGGSVRLDHTQRFNTVRFKSQLNVTAFAKVQAAINSQEISNQLAEATDSDIRSSRTLTLIAENSSDTSILQDRADWEVNIRRIRSKTANVSVVGHSDENGNPWTTNQIANVDISFFGESANMLIDAVAMTYSRNNGSTTNVRLVPQDAYKIQAEQPSEDKRSGDLASILDSSGEG
jgi:prophage tail gpP-like protein